MKNLIFFLLCLYVCNLSNALPTDNGLEFIAPPQDVEIQSKIREKRKSAIPALTENDITVDKPAESKAAQPLEPLSLDKMKNILPPSMNLNEDSSSENVRQKKHACAKQDSPVLVRAAAYDHQKAVPSDLVVVRNEPMEYIPVASQKLVNIAKTVPRTLMDVSVGPISLSPHSAAPSSAAYSGIPMVSTSVFGQSSSYSPVGSYQMRPYQYHYVPQAHHHTVSLRHPAFVDLGPVIYYDRQGDDVAQEVVADDPVSLYCQPMKSTDLIKTLGPQNNDHEGKKLNITDNVDEASHHTEKVNQIQEEITQLNRAAQKLVEQQESLARMQQEHLARASNNVMYSPPMYRQEMRMPPYMYNAYPPYMYNGYPRYTYKYDDGVKNDHGSTVTPSVATAFKAFTQENPHTIPLDHEQIRYSLPEHSTRVMNGADLQTTPQTLRSETGFNVQSIFPRATAPTTGNPSEVVDLEEIKEIKKLLGDNPAKMMKLFQALSQQSEKHMNEHTVTDLAYGADQKLKSEEDKKAPTPQPEDTETEKKHQRRDSRGLVL